MKEEQVYKNFLFQLNGFRHYAFTIFSFRIDSIESCSDWSMLPNHQMKSFLEGTMKFRIYGRLGNRRSTMGIGSGAATMQGVRVTPGLGTGGLEPLPSHRAKLGSPTRRSGHAAYSLLRFCTGRKKNTISPFLYGLRKYILKTKKPVFLKI